MEWKPVRAHETCITNEDSDAIVNCLSTELDGKLFAAGIVYVRIGNGPQQKAVGCLAGTDRFVTTIEHAPAWLAEHGLPAETAAALVAAVETTEG